MEDSAADYASYATHGTVGNVLIRFDVCNATPSHSSSRLRQVQRSLVNATPFGNTSRDGDFVGQRMYAVRHAGVKGLGVYSTRYIPRGTRILAESPLVFVQSERDVFRSSRLLSATDRKHLKSLSINPVRRSSILEWTEAAWHVTRQALTSNTPVSDDTAIQPYLQSFSDYPTVLNIFRNNNFEIGNGTQAVFGGQVSRLNHACVPNAQGNFNASLGKFTIHAIRPIETDEEITLSYLVEHGGLSASRQGHLRDHYGFLCDCPACDLGSERGRKGEDRRIKIQARLHAHAEEAAERELPNEAAELEVMLEMVQMYEAEGIAGRELATMCLAVAELAAKVGRRDLVLEYSEKGLRLDRDAVGVDSSFYDETLARVQAMNGQR